MAVGRAAEDEGVVLVEDEGFALHRPVGELEVNFAGHARERKEADTKGERIVSSRSEKGAGVSTKAMFLPLAMQSRTN